MFAATLMRQMLRQQSQQNSQNIWIRRSYIGLTKSTYKVAATRPNTRLLHGKDQAKSKTNDAFLLVRWTKYVWAKMFGKYLLATNVISSGVLMVVGDFVAQEYEYRRGLRREDHYDLGRMYRMFVAGALMGPLHHYVYHWMDHIMPHATFGNAIKKILIDQLFMSPACIIIFFYSICYLERQTLEATNKELIDKFPYIYMMDWMTWPAVQYINFRYVEGKYRVGFVNVCTALYNVLMSYMKHDFGIHVPLEMSAHEMKTTNVLEVEDRGNVKDEIAKTDATTTR